MLSYYSFERPADQGYEVQQKRANYGQKYYDKFLNINEGGTENMSNSPLVEYTKISPNKTASRTHTIDTITIHCVVGQCSIETLGNIFSSTDRKASSNYGVGSDGRIGMYVEEKDRSWCSSSPSNDDRAITIEVASDTYDPYKVTDAAYKGLIKLLVDICKRNNIPELKWKGDKNLIGQVDKQNMTVHRWFANKSCPGDYLYGLHGKIASDVNTQLNVLEDEDMDVARFKELWTEMRNELQDNESNSYSAEAREWAVNNKIIQGSPDGEFNGMWEDMMTREQFVTVLYRFAKMIGKA